MKKRLFLILIVLPALSISEIKKAEELGVDPVESTFQKQLRQARFNHEWCIKTSLPRQAEERKYIHPDYHLGLSLIEQYTNCYKQYADEAFTALYQQERHIEFDIERTIENYISDRINNDLEYKFDDELDDKIDELVKENLDFIKSQRYALEEEVSSITVKAYENSKFVKKFHSPDERAINREKLVNLGHSFNHYDKAKAKYLRLETFYSQFQEALEELNSNHEWCVSRASPNIAEIDPRYAEGQKRINPNYDPGLGVFEQYINCHKRYAKASLTFICKKEKEYKDHHQYFVSNGIFGGRRDFIKEQLDFIVDQRRAQEEKISSITVKAYENDTHAQRILGSDETRLNREKLVDLTYRFDSCDKVLEE